MELIGSKYREIGRIDRPTCFTRETFQGADERQWREKRCTRRSEIRAADRERNLAADLYSAAQGARDHRHFLVGLAWGGGWTRGSRDSFAGWGGKLAVKTVSACWRSIYTLPRQNTGLSFIGHRRHLPTLCGTFAFKNVRARRDMGVDASAAGSLRPFGGCHLGGAGRPWARGPQAGSGRFGGDWPAIWKEASRWWWPPMGSYDVIGGIGTGVFCPPGTRSDEIPGVELTDRLPLSPAIDPETWMRASPLSHVRAAGAAVFLDFPAAVRINVDDEGRRLLAAQTLHFAEMLEQTGFGVSVVPVSGCRAFLDVRTAWTEPDSRPAQVLPEVVELPTQ